MNRQAAQSWSIRAVVLIALVLFGAWIARNTYWDDAMVPVPLKGEALTNPQYVVRKFFEALDIDVESHQTLDAMPPTTAVIMLHFWHWDLIDSRRDKLEAWVREGGRLIVDTTVIGVFDGSGFGFEELSGVQRRFPPPPKADAAAKRPRVKTDEEEKCALWTLSVDTDGASGDVKRYSLCKLETFGWLVSKKKPTWAVRDKSGMQAVRVPLDKGAITILNATPFDNRNFRDADRGGLLVAATQLRHGDHVWLLTEADHPSLPTLIWRYGAPALILFLLFVFAACWRAAVRFGPLRAPEEITRRSLAEQIRGTGWFILRMGGVSTLYAALRRALKEAADKRIARFSSMTPERQVAALVSHTGLDREMLQQALYPAAEGESGRRQSKQQLYHLIAALETARRALAVEKPQPLSGESANPDIESTAHSEAREAKHAN